MLLFNVVPHVADANEYNWPLAVYRIIHAFIHLLLTAFIDRADKAKSKESRRGVTNPFDKLRAGLWHCELRFLLFLCKKLKESD